MDGIIETHHWRVDEGEACGRTWADYDDEILMPGILFKCKIKHDTDNYVL